MKYTYIKNATVINYDTSRKVFQFDNNGEFETEDKSIIEFMRKYKGHIKCENNAIVSEKIEVKEEVEEKEEIKQEIKEYKCKKCDYTTDNKGLLLAHYRQSHKKVK